MALTIDNLVARYQVPPLATPRLDRPQLAGRATGLVARDRELSDLDRMLTLARVRRAGAVILRGEAGTGKSTLLEAAVARAQDFRIIQLRGVEGQGDAPAHWPAPLIDVLERHRDVAGDATSGQAGTMALRAELTHDCADALRAMIGDAVSPVLIAIDDCQYLPAWLPAALASALVTRLATVPAALVMAWTDAPHAETIDLHNVEVTEHYVGGLPTISLCSRLLEMHGHRDIATPVLEWMFAQTHGNPMCLVDGYSRLSGPQRADWQLLPPVVPMGNEIVRSYGSFLADLPEATALALGVVAAGRVKTSEYTQIFAQVGLEPHALQEARSLGILVQRGDRIDFAHPLVAAAAYHLLPPTLRTATHRALSETLSRQGSIERGAYHAGLAVQRPDAEVSAHHQQAALRSLERGAPREAARHEEAAAAFAPTPDGQALCQACASELWLMAAEHERAQQCASQAVELAKAPAIRAKALYHQARVLFQVSAGQGVLDLLSEAIALCGTADPVLAVLAELDAAACLVLRGRYEEAVGRAANGLAAAAPLNSELESLARAMHGVVSLLAGLPLDPVSDITNPLSQLMRTHQRFHSSPQVALTIGLGALLATPPEMAEQWVQWIHEFAVVSGDRPLRAVAPLLRAMVAMARNRGEGLEALLEDAATKGDESGLTILATQARALGGYVGAARNDAHGALSATALVLGEADDVGPRPHVQAHINMAILELTAQRRSASLTWVRAAMEYVDGPHAVGLDFAVLNAPVLGVMCLLTRTPSDAQRLLRAVEVPLSTLPRYGTVLGLFRGMCEPDVDLALEHLQAVRSSPESAPMLVAHVDLCAGLRLVGGARVDEGRVRLERARSSYERLGAFGFALLAAQELAEDAPDRAQQPLATASNGAAPAPGQPARVGSEHAWDLSLLGEFMVMRHGHEVTIPQSLAAQALKIVALHKKIHVDELVEMLWPEAEPGVGSRRLRNVLWRIRGACGDLLQREGNLICLARDASTDIDRFEETAAEALTCEGGPEEVARLAADAVTIYRGELLPGDRYADWAAAYREALLRRHASMLELLVSSSLAENRYDQALAYLERLIETDPFEEHYYLQAAEIHAQTGQVHRARNALERASRMLEDLGVPPSPALLRAKQSLPAD